MYEKLQRSVDKDNEANSSKQRIPLKIKGTCTSKFYRTIELSISVEILSNKLNVMLKKTKWEDTLEKFHTVIFVAVLL